MTTQLFNKLNNLDWSDNNIAAVINYKLHNQLPPGMDAQQKFRFQKHYQNFTTRNNKLYYGELEVVPNNEKQQVMQDMFDDIRTGVAASKYNWYRRICTKYINIKLADCSDFLQSQSDYQLGRQDIDNYINKPILATKCGERWGCDCINMRRYEGHNHGYNTIFTVIDYFSRKLWARAMRSQTATETRDALASICQEAGMFPYQLQHDRGGEFLKTFEPWVIAHGIKNIETTTYNPRSNGLCENANKKVRRAIRDVFIRNGNMDWRHYLQACVDAINSTPNSSTKYAPDYLWMPSNFYNYVPGPGVVRALPVNERRRVEVSLRLRENARKQIEKNKVLEFQVGDHVRVKMSKLYSFIRGIIKNKNKKWLTIMFSPEVYVVDKIMQPDNVGLEKNRYLLVDLHGNKLVTEYNSVRRKMGGGSQRFFASDMIHADKTDETTWTNERAYNTNVKYEPNARLLRTDVEQIRGEPWIYKGDRLEPKPRAPRGPNKPKGEVAPIERPKRSTAGVNHYLDSTYDTTR